MKALDSFTVEQLNDFIKSDHAQCGDISALARIALAAKSGDLFIGMDIGVDVSTCEADSLNRYYGTVTEVSELETKKNGVILLVQDAEPNFATTPQLNSPEMPDGWIKCSDRMPEDDDFVLIWPLPDFGVELHVGQYIKFHKNGPGWFAQVSEQNYGIEFYPITVTHWVPLPAAPEKENG